MVTTRADRPAPGQASPYAGPFGFAGGDLAALGDRLLASWDTFLDLAANADHAERTRLPGWRVRELLVHLGTWPDKDSISAAVASARSGVTGTALDPDAGNAAVIAAHPDATRADIDAALRRTRDTAAALLKSRMIRGHATRPAASWVGPLPLATFLHAGCYELAVHALDLADAGAPDPPEALLDAGIAALFDVTGALAARHGVDARAGAVTPYGGWRFTAASGGWVTEPVTAQAGGPLVQGAAKDVLEASSGRASVPGLLLRRRLKVSDLTGFLALAPLVAAVPTLPGGPLLAKAAGALGRFRS